jgi:FdhD protein
VVADPASEDNVIRVTLRRGLRVDLERLRRNLYASSSCGICGKATIDNVLQTAPPLSDASRFAARFFHALPKRLRESQAVFSQTGGLHAAGIFSSQGDLLVVREDVGRHNAVDKAIGWAVRGDRLPLGGHVLMVSGRISYEIVQKALAARIPVVAAVSAPSSLAIELAERAGMMLIGFLRGSGFNVYGQQERIQK